MAKQTGLLQFTGKLGNVIGYRRNGSYFIRSMPDTVQQTTATRRASRDFGIASRKGKLIRRAITPHLAINPGGTLVNRLNKALITATRDRLPELKGFRFNPYTGVEQFFSLQPIITTGGILHIPAQKLWPPAKATHLEIVVVAVRINFAQRQITGRTESATTIDLSQPFNGAELAATVPGRGTLLVTLQVRAYEHGAVIENRRSKAADIIAVVVPATIKKQPVKVNSVPRVKRMLPYQSLSTTGKVVLSVPARQRE
ncbi:hypothetical protein SAMN05660461_1340 [Chitinophaga ginsengisegetis]|uniref:Uncharacterized protein n=1 Tax=Chitinophaga ginsengisegetis TaxID=393003 RepID=A0A1T5NF42_9BACT|nr:hypothetical protein [Chitinophaga ginsengisegetis]SKC99027.1 hypothetical protein SAMN05660461_1340 [Chitinophaga ginsengisegetis]